MQHLAVSSAVLVGLPNLGKKGRLQTCPTKTKRLRHSNKTGSWTGQETPPTTLTLRGGLPTAPTQWVLLECLNQQAANGRAS
jgi:hypothetical protein